MSEAKWMSVWGYSAIAKVVVGASENAVVMVELWLLQAKGVSKRAANANEIRLLGYVTQEILDHILIFSTQKWDIS